jgi:streptogramin lyase
MTSQRVVFKRERGLHDLSFDGTDVWAAHSSGHLSVVAPETTDIRTIRLKDQPFVYASHFDGRDIWAGLYGKPGRLVRVGRQTGRCDEFVIHEAPRWSIRGIASDGKCIWACLYTVPAMVAIVDPHESSCRVVRLGRPDDLKLCTSIVFDGKSMWVGLDTMPATVVRIDVDSHQYRAYTFHAQSSCCRSLVVADAAVWAGLYTEPAQIIRFDPETLGYATIPLPDAYFNTRDLACDGKNLWIGLQNVRYGPSALYRLPMAECRTRDVVPSKVSAATPASYALRPLEEENGKIAITSQDWYRVRRGEDQLAWGKVRALDDLPKVVLSHRAADELAFLDADQRGAILRRLAKLSTEPRGQESKPVGYGGPRRLSPVEDLRIVYRVNDHNGKLLVSTIRKRIGVSFDPENMGPPPR